MSDDPKKVLWIDDDARDFLAPLGRMLQRNGIDLDVATTFHEAEQFLQKRNYSSVLMDLIIPSGFGSMLPYSGVTIIENIRSGKYCKNSEGTQATIPIVILSVVRHEELGDLLKDLSYNYIDKTRLLETNVLRDLIETLAES
jgi:DNA-binding response OmpR family regulator